MGLKFNGILTVYMFLFFFRFDTTAIEGFLMSVKLILMPDLKMKRVFKGQKNERALEGLN